MANGPAELASPVGGWLRRQSEREPLRESVREPVSPTSSGETAYDAVPYLSRPVDGCHPEALAVAGRLFGLDPPDPSRCRVLELGCASGGNLMPMALSLPEADFVGVDSSRVQIDEGLRATRVEPGERYDDLVEMADELRSGFPRRPAWA